MDYIKNKFNHIFSDKEITYVIDNWNKYSYLEAKCPSCKHELARMPKGKSKCKSCKKNINVIKNSPLNKTVLFSDPYKNIFAELKSISNGSWDLWFDSISQIMDTRKELSERFKCPFYAVLFNDLKWQILNDKRLIYYSLDRRFYINLTMLMIIICNDENSLAGRGLAFEYIYDSAYVFDRNLSFSYMIEPGSLFTLLKCFERDNLNLYKKTKDPSYLSKAFMNMKKATFLTEFQTSLNEYPNLDHIDPRPGSW